jgi:hypothetical protein
VERGWFFQVDREVTITELYGGGDAGRSWTLRLRDAGTGSTPTAGTVLESTSVAGIACSDPALPGNTITDVTLVPGRWYAVTSQDEGDVGPHCTAANDSSVAFGAAGTSIRPFGGAPGVPVGFRVGSIP